jgi:hypothetical protein
MDAAWAKVLTDWAQFLLAGAVGGVLAMAGYFVRRDKVYGGRISALRSDFDQGMAEFRECLERLEALRAMAPDQRQCVEQVSRIVALEHRVALGPTQADIARAHARMDGHLESLAEIRGGVKRIEHTVDMLSQFMLEHGPRAEDR